MPSNEPAITPAAPTTPAERLLRALPVLLLVAVFLLLIAPVLDPGVQLFYRDTGRLQYPVKKFIAETLRSGHLPLWDPWTESGTSILAQVTPGLFHPFTLLYLLLPFDWAFKLNHLLTLPLAGLGAFLLARRLGASRWGAAVAAATYGGCGFLISMTAGNVTFALGPAGVPLAIDAFLAFAALRTPSRLLWAAFALALPALAGDPQSMLIAGVIGAALVMVRAVGGGDPAPVRERLRRGVRAGLITAAWGLCALGLSAPIALPAAARLRDSGRGKGVSAVEQAMFLVTPPRLAGYLVPKAFDDPTEIFDRPGLRSNPFSEYLGLESRSAFSDSIVIGAPALLLALLGCFAGRTGRFLFAAALLFALASTGDTLGVQTALMAAVPFFRYFRYAEKFAAPATLLVALAAALGTDLALSGTRRAAAALAALSFALGASTGAVVLLLPRFRGSVSEWLIFVGATHDPGPAARFLVSLRSGLGVVCALSLTLGVIALLRAALRIRAGGALAALCCCAAVLASNTDSLITAPVELLHGPFLLGEYLQRRAGPSEGRWRLFTNADVGVLPLHPELGERLAGQEGVSQALVPQFEMLAGIEGASSYFSAPDKPYAEAFRVAPFQTCLLLGVRFLLALPGALDVQPALLRGFRELPRGYLVRELPVRPRAFVVAAARAVNDAQLLGALSEPGFSSTAEALLPEENASLAQGLDAHPIGGGEGAAGSARWSRPDPDDMRVEVDAHRRGLLIVGEHFDPGWLATVDGAPAPVARVDGAAFGIPVQAGKHRVKMGFHPVGFAVGLWLCAATLAALAGWALWRRAISVRPVTGKVTQAQATASNYP